MTNFYRKSVPFRCNLSSHRLAGAFLSLCLNSPFSLAIAHRTQIRVLLKTPPPLPPPPPLSEMKRSGVILGLDYAARGTALRRKSVRQMYNKSVKRLFSIKQKRYKNIHRCSMRCDDRLTCRFTAVSLDSSLVVSAQSRTQSPQALWPAVGLATNRWPKSLPL